MSFPIHIIPTYPVSYKFCFPILFLLYLYFTIRYLRYPTPYIMHRILFIGILLNTHNREDVGLLENYRISIGQSTRRRWRNSEIKIFLRSDVQKGRTQSRCLGNSKKTLMKWKYGFRYSEISAGNHRTRWIIRYMLHINKLY